MSKDYPLVPLPITEALHERIAMDLVRPLVKTTRGHQYILVIMDYITKDPQGIPLHTVATKIIAKELFLLLSRVGILDYGTDLFFCLLALPPAKLLLALV